jgi:transposase
MRKLVDDALTNLDSVFDEIYTDCGRPSIPPERLICASLLQGVYSVRSERQLMEQLDCHLMFRWSVGLSVDEPVWNPSTLSKNRDRLARADIGRRLFEEIVEMTRLRSLTSNDHFSVDGTLIAACVSYRSVRRKDDSDDDNPDGAGRNAGRNFHGEKRSNKTHASRTAPEALIASKGQGMGARPSYTGHTLMENRNGLLVNADLTLATGTAQLDAAIDMAAALKSEATLGADKKYDTREFVDVLRFLDVTPHVAQNLKRPGGSAIDGRTTRCAGHQLSQRVRRRV